MTECSRCGFSLRRSARHMDHISPYEPYLGLPLSLNPAAPPTLAPQVKLFVKAVETELLDCDADIARLETVLQQVKNERKAGQTLLDRHRYLLSSFHNLPPEVMVHIFMLCGYNDTGHFEIHTTHCAPWQLERVCSRWRNIIRTTPSIWKSFGVRYLATPSSRGSSRLNDALVKSLPLPLHISVGLSNVSNDLIKTVFDHSSRWETMAFEGHITDYLSLQYQGADFMPNMTKLSLSILPGTATLDYEFDDDDGDGVILDDAIQPFIRCPAIQDLSLTTTGVAYWSRSPTSLLFPWSGLTKLVLMMGGDLSPVRLLIMCCVNLLTLEVTGFGDWDEDELIRDNAETPVRHSTITSMVIKNSLDLLSRIECPALERLSVSGTDIQHIRHFLTSSSCSLTRVELFNPSSISPDLQTLIMMPQLSEVLELDIYFTLPDGQGWEEPDFDVLAQGHTFIVQNLLTLSTNCVPFPKLQTLSLHFPYHLVELEEEASVETLISTVESRWNFPELYHARKLRTLNLIGGRILGFQRDYSVDSDDEAKPQYVDRRDELRRKFDGSDLMKAVKKLKDEGLTVSVTGIVGNRDSLWKESFETYL